MFDLLTPREREVTVLIANGKCNKEIAARVGISMYTVKSHVRNVMEKLGLYTRLQIAAKANQERRLLRHELIVDSGPVDIRSATPARPIAAVPAWKYSVSSISSTRSSGPRSLSATH